jgi:dethiobiotin synthetase
MTAIFITATGTDIGKTFVASGLIRYWRAMGKPVDALKPVATGFDAANAPATDPGVLLAALGRPAEAGEIDRISPWRYAAPLSPDMAARKENRPLHFGRLVDFCRRAIETSEGALLIEGIGGVMVPLDEKHTVLDWIVALNVPVVLLTGSYLGALSHSLTALDALQRNRVALKAILVNETQASTVPLAETTATLSRFSGNLPVLTLPRLPAADADHAAFGELASVSGV